MEYLSCTLYVLFGLGARCSTRSMKYLCNIVGQFLSLLNQYEVIT